MIGLALLIAGLADRDDAAILQQQPPPPRTLNPKISDGLERIILRALQKDPEERYQSAGDLRIDLNSLATGTAPVYAKPQTSRWWLYAVATTAVPMAPLANSRATTSLALLSLALQGCAGLPGNEESASRGFGFVQGVGIGEQQPGIGGLLGAQRNRVILPYPAGWQTVNVEETQFGVLGRERIYDFGGFVRGLIVDDNDFRDFGLLGQRLDARGDGEFFIAGGDDG